MILFHEYLVGDLSILVIIKELLLDGVELLVKREQLSPLIDDFVSATHFIKFLVFFDDLEDVQCLLRVCLVLQ